MIRILPSLDLILLSYLTARSNMTINTLHPYELLQSGGKIIVRLVVRTPA